MKKTIERILDHFPQAKRIIIEPPKIVWDSGTFEKTEKYNIRIVWGSFPNCRDFKGKTLEETIEKK